MVIIMMVMVMMMIIMMVMVMVTRMTKEVNHRHCDHQSKANNLGQLLNRQLVDCRGGDIVPRCGYIIPDYSIQCILYMVIREKLGLQYTCTTC